MRTLLGARHIPGPKPTEEHNRCELKPGTPRVSGKALFLVCPLPRLHLYVVCFGCRVSHSKTGSRGRVRNTFRMAGCWTDCGLSTVEHHVRRYDPLTSMVRLRSFIRSIKCNGSVGEGANPNRA
jgi:hypothetical protein